MDERDSYDPVASGKYDWALTLLGIDRDATQDEARAAYRKLAWRLHPDRNIGVMVQGIFCARSSTSSLLRITGFPGCSRVRAEPGAHDERAHGDFSISSRRARELHQGKVPLVGEVIDG